MAVGVRVVSGVSVGIGVDVGVKVLIGVGVVAGRELVRMSGIGSVEVPEFWSMSD